MAIYSEDNKTLIEITDEDIDSSGRFVVPHGVTSIGMSAIEFCTSLVSIKIPDSVTSIGERAFADCTSLSRIKIPEGVTSIGDEAFIGCTSLTSIRIPSSVVCIGESAFRDCISLTRFEIPNGVKEIGSGILVDTSIKTTVYSSNKIVYVPKTAKGLFFIKEGTTCINSEAFAGCASLTFVRIPSSVTCIGFYAFSGCSSLTEIVIPDSVKEIGSGILADTGIKKTIYFSNSLIHVPKSAEGQFCIKEGTTSIDDSAFAGCTAITSVEIPTSVTNIGNLAFEGCSHLTKIEIPNSVINIGDYVFSGCYALKDVYVKYEDLTVVNIGMKAFRIWEDMTLHIPSGTEDAYMNHPEFGQFENILINENGIDIEIIKSPKIEEPGTQKSLLDNGLKSINTDYSEPSDQLKSSPVSDDSDLPF